MRSDIKIVKQSNKTLTLTLGNKTRNIHRSMKENDSRLFSSAVTSTYNKVNNSIQKSINIDGGRLLKIRDILKCLEIN